ncbi:RNA polymerase factor sigma-54 [Gemmata sp. JC717]|uniref:RNA polymerase factor sigma-54 n=1 Tax=Gemmata algarum TaxID=2975278 RepID=A0ABU5F552_9BACT|nr:RNA polymerase factor sigma-54 [Gemmata algarum]MDY3554318.1 RNA polymerase factor sigma-54 [Gemmata algarum]MDY3562713.1 RNA polymerase factor sigma-54 [Gemmata algarum]
MSGIRLGINLVPRQDLRQVLAPRMIQSMEILQLSITDLQAKIDDALQENPFLELKEKLGETDEPPTDFNPDAPLKHDETGDLEFNRLEELNRDWDDHFNEEHRGSRASLEEEGDRKLEAMANMPDRPPSLQDYLADQIGELDIEEDDRRLARHICSFVDRTGYLGARERANENDDKDTFRTVTLDEIAALYDRLVTPEDVEDVLVHVVQRLEPAGVAARDLKECLLLQVPHDAPHADALRTLIRDHLEDVAYNRIPVIQKATRLEIAAIQEAIEEIHHLDPKPGLKFSDSGTQYVMPDVVVERADDNDYTVRLTDEWVPRIRVSKRVVDMCKRQDLDDKVKDKLRQKLQQADWLVKAVEQRRNTLMKVTKAIIDHQRAFLDFGPEHIQPLKMQQIADQVKVHVTTVSRAVDDKWVQTPRGVFPLKRFFGGGKAKDENDVNSEVVAYEVMKQKLLELVSNEDKANPLSDEELVARLKAGGCPVARRTVTKYRKMLKIPSSRQRKDWSLSGTP